MTPGDDDQHDDEHDDAHTLVRWTQRGGRPLSHPHRHTVARHAEGSSESPAVDVMGSEPVGSALATTRIERIEQAALLVHCRPATAESAPVELAPDLATVPLVVPIETPVTAPAWPRPRAPASLPVPAPPVARDPTPVPRPVPGPAAPRRRRWSALAVVIVVAASGAAGYEVAVHAGDAILARLR